jgi:HEAT repeat protein
MISHGEFRDEGVRPAFRLLRTNVTSATIEELARLMNATHAPQTARKATCILLELAPAGLPPIVKVIENPRHPMRELAVYGVAVAAASLGPTGEQLVPGLIECLRDTTPDTAENAALALGRLKMSPQPAVAALISCIQSPNPKVRCAAAISLSDFQTNALIALPALTNLLADTDQTVRGAATNAVQVLSALALTNAPPQ